MPSANRWGRWVVVVAATLLGAATLPAPACDNPVFRYALENWPAEDFQLLLACSADPAPATREAWERLASAAATARPRANLRLAVAERDGLAREALAGREGEFLALVAPPREDRPGPPRVVWSAPFSAAAVARVGDSPARREIAKRLLGGQAIVWVVLETGDTTGLDEGIRDLETLARNYAEAVAAESEEQLKNPPPPIPGAPPPLPPIDKSAFWPPRFSTLRVRADDPEEEVLVAMLRGAMEPPAGAAPVVFPVFGRGRVLGSIALATLDAARFRSASDFLTGACSCEVKELNPGEDLLVAADWDSVPKVTRQPGALSLAELEVGDPLAPPPGEVVHERGDREEPALVPPAATATPVASPAAVPAAVVVSVPTSDASSTQRTRLPLAGVLAAAAVLLLVAGFLLRRRR